MRILTRYIFREMLGPTFLGFSFYTFIFLMKSVFDLAEMIIKRSLPFPTVLRLLGFSLPHIVVLTVPMALLFGILIAVGRLSADSEIVAMRSAGISTATIYRPVFLFSFLVFAFNVYLMNFVLPKGNTAFIALKSELLTSAIENEIKPRVFYDEYENRVIYVNDVDPTNGTWKGVFISDATDPQEQRVIIADKGRLATAKGNRQLWLELEGAEIHSQAADKPERYGISQNRSQRILLMDKFSQPAENITIPRSAREMDMDELLAGANRVRISDPFTYRNNMVEVHKKFAIPFACLTFGLIGLPLGITNRRGGKSSGFSLSIGIILLYYVLLNQGEELGRSGKLQPALAIWMPNAVLLALGLFLLYRANSDSGQRSGFAPLQAARNWMRRRRPVTDSNSTGQVERPPLLSRFDIPFPNILDRYILSEFAKVLGMVLISTVILFVIIDYVEVSEEARNNNVSFSVVAEYYRYFVLQILNYTLPLSILLATLITFGLLARNNEITALKANGISLYRVTLPIIIMASVAAGVSYLLQDFVLPYSNQRVNELKGTIRGKVTARSFSPDHKQWLFGKGPYLFNFLSFDAREKVISQLQVFEFDPSTFKLTRRVWTQEARFDGVGWVFVNGSMRSFSPGGESSYSPIVEPIRLFYPERPEYFALEVKAPNQMNFQELRRYIRDLKQSGYASDELMVELYEKTSWPFLPLVMALIALPFSFRMGKQGALYGIGLALFLAFIYWTLFGIFTKFGDVGNLPAILSAWSANVLFILAAVFLFLRVET